MTISCYNNCQMQRREGRAYIVARCQNMKGIAYLLSQVLTIRPAFVTYTMELGLPVLEHALVTLQRDRAPSGNNAGFKNNRSLRHSKPTDALKIRPNFTIGLNSGRDHIS
jgi:hypothetical protein